MQQACSGAREEEGEALDGASYGDALAVHKLEHLVLLSRVVGEGVRAVDDKAAKTRQEEREREEGSRRRVEHGYDERHKE